MRQLCIVWMLLLLLAAGCGKQQGNRMEKEFSVCSEEQIPKEIQEMIEEKKEMPFQFTYSLQEYMYIIVGYGVQKGGGYSIEVLEFSEDNENIYVDTNLLGNDQEKETVGKTYPYIVLKCIKPEKNVIFLAYK